MSSEQTTLKVSTRQRKSLAIRPSLNLLFMAFLALLLPGLLLLPFPLLRVPLGLVGIFLIPGHALVKALFPREADLSGIERAGLSFGLSVAVLPVMALVLDRLPWGIRPWPVALSLSAWSFVCYVIAALRRLGIGEDLEETHFSRLHSADRWGRREGHNRRKYWIGAAALACLLLAAGFVLVTPDPSSEFTEFYMLGADGLAENYPSEISLGEQVVIPVGITNQEGTRVSYRVEVQSSGQTLSQVGPVTLKNGETWENDLSFTLPTSGDNQQVDILLFFVNGTTPHRSLKLWVNVHE